MLLRGVTDLTPAQIVIPRLLGIMHETVSCIICGNEMQTQTHHGQFTSCLFSIQYLYNLPNISHDTLLSDYIKCYKTPGRLFYACYFIYLLNWMLWNFLTKPDKLFGALK